MSSYHQALEFARFGSELAAEAQRDLNTGKRVLELLNQAPGENYSLVAQQLMFEIVLDLEEGAVLDIAAMKTKANQIAATVQDAKDDKAYDKAKEDLKKVSIMELKK
jgi:F0F1-type ATP synthase alpha subunit